MCFLKKEELLEMPRGWRCSSAGRVLVWHAERSRFSSQHCINQLGQHAPIIPVVRRRQQECLPPFWAKWDLSEKQNKTQTPCWVFCTYAIFPNDPASNSQPRALMIKKSHYSCELATKAGSWDPHFQLLPLRLLKHSHKAVKCQQ